MQRSFFDLLDVLPTQSAPCTFEPVGDQSVELDAAAEIAAFVTRPDRSAAFESSKPMQSPQTPFSTGLTPFAEAAGIYSQQ